MAGSSGPLTCFSTSSISPRPPQPFSAAGGSSSRAIASRGPVMDYLLAGVVATLLFGYLIYALLRPERF
jgi:K+-transporting ATPase KdpF subunit